MGKLKEIAYGRSGDKGRDANIAIIAYKEEDYEKLLQFLTETRVSNFLSDLNIDKITRYELPNLYAVNFVLEGVLDRGGSLSLRSDAQGKGLAQYLLEIEC